ncbi:MAG: amino acid adenylation domain-containing protein [Candidatus Aminicenantes bacterium]|jgi:amino acid adenylation domain-containing protein/thioester reductase-like protein
MHKDKDKNSLEKEKKNNQSNSKDKLKPIRLAISATFTSEPIKDYIHWWGEQFGYDIKVKFADYNQVFQELANENSLISTNEGVNLILVRFEDWVRSIGDLSDIKKIGKLEEFYDELIDLFESKPKPIPYFVGIFPVSTHLSLSRDLLEYMEETYTRWQEDLEETENVYIIDFNPLKDRYNCEQVFDPLSDREGHLPFTGEYYAAMGTFTARIICGYMENNFKKSTEEMLNSNQLVPMQEYTARDLQELLIEKEVDEMAPLVEEDAPGNETQRKLAEVWEKTLRTRVPGINFSFFKLGGDSLKVVTLIAEIHKTFNVELSMNHIFDNKTIKEQAQLVEGAEKSTYIEIEPARKQDNYPLSSAQRRLYILHLMEPQSVNYNIPKIYLMEEEPNEVRLKNAFYKLILRHESFRTSIHMIESELVQKVHENVDFDLKDYVMGPLDTGEYRGKKQLSKNEKLELKLNEIMIDFVKPFDLSHPPLMRAGMIRTDDGKYFLVVDMHHIISDGISYEIFKKELMDFYESKELPPLTIQYKDFAVWQGKETIKDRLMKQKDYWNDVFSGEIPVLNLLLDYERPSTQSFEGNTINFELSNEKINALEELARNEGTTLFMVLLAIFNILLCRLSGQGDIVVGTPVGGRRHSDVEGIIGMFVNTLALRIYPSGEKTFTGFLKEIKKTTLDAFENQEYPFEELVDILDIKRDISRNPLFDVVFALQNMEEIEFYKHKKIKPFKFGSNTSKFDISLIAEVIEEGLSIDVEYCTRLFREKTIRRFISYFKTAADKVIKEPVKKISDIEIITVEEKRGILYEFNETKAKYPKEKTVHELVEESVKKNPDKIVLVYNHIKLSFKELNKRANQVGNYLYSGKQIKLEEPVGILMDKSPDIIAAILGILKAGGVYVTLVPSLPFNRIKYMINDTGIETIFAQERHIQILNQLQKECKDLHTYLCMDSVELNSEEMQRDTGKNQSDLRELDKYRKEQVHREVRSNNQAYVIYTSGTTGIPKGVVVGHRSLVNLCYWHNRYYQVTESDNATQYAAFSFDASVWEVFPYLVIGATLHLISDKIKLDVEKMGQYFEENNITISFLPTQFCELFMKRDIRSLRKLLTGGDKLRIFVERGFKLYNNYGPTENTVVTTSYQVISHMKNIPIGKPIDNNKIYILDKDGQHLVPIGVAGELCIGGESLALGYLNRPELTAEKFPENPFEPGERIYKSGDLVKWLPDGNIEYLGRIDQQVKIRGFRIEIGEIEAQVLLHKDITEGAVIVRDDNAGEKYLCAYVVSDKKIDASILADSLSKVLPDYMIPSYFIQLEEIPLTPNGKVNRKELPVPDISAMGKEYSPPRNTTDKKLVEIWAKLLNMKEDKIGIDDDFFRLGGHSLKASIMIAVIHKTLNVKLLMHEIFKMSTIRKLGDFLIKSNKEEYTSIEFTEKREYYPQTSAQKRIYFMDQLESISILYNMPMMDIYGKGIDKDILQEAFRKLIQRHESLRTSFHTIGTQAVQIVHDFEELESTFEIDYYETDETGMIYSDQPGKEWTKVDGLPFHNVIEQFVNPFNLSQSPLLRVGLLKIYGNMQILMMDMHHIMIDGISLKILLNELWELYDGEALSPLKIQYKDFTQWINREEQQEEIKKQEKFWLKEFEGDIPLLNLPLDYVRPSEMNFKGDVVYFEIGKKETQKLNLLVQDHGETMYIILLAAYYILLAKLSGQEEIVIGTWTGGRGHAELQDIIGMFVVTLPLSNYPERTKTFREFLGEVKQKTITAFEHQDYPLEQLVSKVSKNHETNRNPLFDVVFSLENEAEKTEEYLLDVLLFDKDNPYAFKLDRAKFDLTLVGAERGDILQFYLEYNTKLFKEETIERFITYLQKIISSVCQNIDQKIVDIDILSDEEKKKILFEFNDTIVDYPNEKTIHQLFEQQVEKTPGNIAAIFRGEKLTYEELDVQANQLAWVLRGKGVKPDFLVGIMVSRSMQMMVALLGVLKAGGAYVPIDPEYPADRVEYMIRDSNTTILLTQKEIMNKFVDSGFNAESIDLFDKSIYDKNKTRLENITTPHDLSYVIYTSGSTGRPKGVMIRHRNAVNFFKGMTEKIDFSPGKSILAVTTLCFDIFLLETLLPVTIGVEVVIAEERQQRDPESLKKIITENRVNMLQLTPSRLKLLLSSGDNVDYLEHITDILVGGEQFPQNLFEELKEKYQGNIIDVYGPTETTVWSTLKDLTAEKKINIGKPIANTQVYIIDISMVLQPIGLVGELYIGGDGVARGYLNRIMLTTERFIPNPLKEADDPNRPYRNIYRTGDLARWLPDGNLECLGRIDHQVKIRGFRIEIEEIENQVLKQEEVKEVVVVVREETPGDKYLCAYIVSDEELDMSSVRNPLVETLPDYMVPSYFMQLEKIPLTPNGKVDRKALPAPEGKVLAAEYAPPTNEIEKIMAEEWSEVLGIDKVGIDDNFFEIGGDSLKTILVSGRLQNRKLKINVNEFFSKKTIRQLAKYVEGIATNAKEVTAPIDETLIDDFIERDYQAYIKRIKREKWHALGDKNDYKHIMVSGVTGYLGAYLTYELLNSTNSILYLLVRGNSQEEARERLKKKMVFYFDKDFFNKQKERIVVIKADLAEDKLGIDASYYDKLTEIVDAVVHSAARVKHYGFYDEFYKDNVIATEKLLEFAVTGKKKDFHFISTMDVGRGNIHNKNYLVFTEYCHDERQRSDNVYLKSKLEAEKRVLAYRGKGINTSIYRAGNVTFHSETGHFQENIQDNAFYAIMKGIIKIGTISKKMMKLEFDMAFVNYTAKAIVMLLTRSRLKNNTYHIYNPNKLALKDMILFLKKLGMDIKNLKENEVEEYLAKFAGNIEYEKIIERLRLDSWLWEERPATLTVPKNDRTVMLLKRIGFKWPKVNYEHIDKMIAHCKQIGFL